MANSQIMLLDHFENKIVVEGTLLTLTALHIGSGKNNFSPLDADNTVIRNALTNEPYIPGSSIKGVLRAYMETLLANFEDYHTCIVTENPCLGKPEDKKDLRKLKEQYKGDAEQLAIHLYKELCPSCRLFGSQVMASKLQIKDAMLLEKVPVEVRDGVAIDRDTGTAVNGKKYNFECVTAGAKFKFLMTVDNAEEDLQELVKMIIRVLKSGELTLGGRKSIGLGEVKLVDEKIYFVDKKQLRTYAVKGLQDEMRWENV